MQSEIELKAKSKKQLLFILRIGFLEALIVLGGLIFLRKEVYTQAKLSSLAFRWQEYLVVLCFFIDGLIHGAFDFGEQTSLFSRRFLCKTLPVLLFFYVASVALCQKMHFCMVSDNLFQWSGVLLLIGSLLFNWWTRLRGIKTFYSSVNMDIAEQNPKEITKVPTNLWQVICCPDRLSILIMLIGLTLCLKVWLPLLAVPGILVLLKWGYEISI